MDQDVIDDLKQFITATISQQTAILATKADIGALDKKLSAKIDTLQTSVAEALDTSNDTVDGQLKDHELRITKLEQRPA